MNATPTKNESEIKKSVTKYIGHTPRQTDTNKHIAVYITFGYFCIIYYKYERKYW